MPSRYGTRLPNGQILPHGSTTPIGPVDPPAGWGSPHVQQRIADGHHWGDHERRRRSAGPQVGADILAGPMQSLHSFPPVMRDLRAGRDPFRPITGRPWDEQPDGPTGAAANPWLPLNRAQTVQRPASEPEATGNQPEPEPAQGRPWDPPAAEHDQIPPQDTDTVDPHFGPAQSIPSATNTFRQSFRGQGRRVGGHPPVRTHDRGFNMPREPRMPGRASVWQYVARQDARRGWQ